MAPQTFELFIDGASHGNPGPAGIGVVVRDGDGDYLLKRGEFIGKATNNVAEYTALIRGLEYLDTLLERQPREPGALEVRVFSDSQLIVRQVTGEYKIKNTGLQPLAIRAQKLMRKFPNLLIASVPREENALADNLAGKAVVARETVDEA